MQIISEKKHRKNLYIMTFVVIYLTDSLLFATNSNLLFLYGKRFGVIIFALAMLFMRNKGDKSRIPVSLFCLSCSILVSALLAGRIFNGYSYYTMIAIIWFSYCFAEKFTFQEFADVFCEIMRLIAVISIIAWFFSASIRQLSFLPTITNKIGLRYRFLFLTNIPMQSNLARRNLGPFWEPGAYQVYLVVALYFTLFVRNQKKIWIDTGVYILTGLTTMSGAVLIPIALLISAYLFENKNIKGFTLSAILTILLVLLMESNVFDEIYNKLNSESNSFIFRLIGMQGALDGFLKNPLFGSSPEENEAIKSALAVQYFGFSYASNTNTFINFLAYYGVFVGGFMIINSYRIIYKSVQSKLTAILIFAAYFLSTSNENMTASLLIGVIALYGWYERTIPLWKSKKYIE